MQKSPGLNRRLNRIARNSRQSVGIGGNYQPCNDKDRLNWRVGCRQKTGATAFVQIAKVKHFGLSQKQLKPSCDGFRTCRPDFNPVRRGSPEGDISSGNQATPNSHGGNYSIFPPVSTCFSFFFRPCSGRATAARVRPATACFPGRAATPQSLSPHSARRGFQFPFPRQLPPRRRPHRPAPGFCR